MSQLWQTFDPRAEFTVIERRLPHWSQAGAICFLTWRTVDSLPQSVLRSWYADREAWLSAQGIDPRALDWKNQLHQLEPDVRATFFRMFSQRWHKHLDEGYGACPLRRPNISQIVSTSLQMFDGDRYDLADFVIMPNHIHVLAAFVSEDGMLKQCESWKHYTAREINRTLNLTGRFWQQDGFDHLVRHEHSFHAFRNYIANNGPKAQLPNDQYRHYSKPL
jgi:putative transposase